MAIVIVATIGAIGMIGGMDRVLGDPAPPEPRQEVARPEARSEVRLDELDRRTLRRSDAGIVCDGPTDPVACINLVTELGLRDTDEIRLLGGQVVIAGTDGSLRAARLRDGTTRWRHAVPGTPTLHPVVAEVLPITHDAGVDLVRLDGGDVLGRLDIDADTVGGVGPWVVTADADQIAAWSISANPGWQRPLDVDSQVQLAPEAATIVTPGRVEVLFGNTGNTRVTVELDGEVVGVHRRDDRTTVVTARPAAVVQADRDGVVTSRVRLPGTEVVAQTVDPSDRRIVTLTTDAAERTHWLTIVDLAAEPRPRYVPLPGPAPRLAPVVDPHEVVVARSGRSRQLQVIGLADGATRSRIPLAREAIGLGRSPRGALVTLDDLGTVRLLDPDDARRQRRIELGPGAQPIDGHPLLIRRGSTIVALADLP